MDLIRIGYFSEMPHGEQTDPSIKNFIGKLEHPEDKSNICKYLETGIPIAICCGTENDVIDPEKGVAGCPSMLTDGVYVWPGDLSYYVRIYNVSIGTDFYKHMKDNNWVIPINENDINVDDIFMDGQLLFP